MDDAHSIEIAGARDSRVVGINPMGLVTSPFPINIKRNSFSTKYLLDLAWLNPYCLLSMHFSMLFLIS
jgi:hypothetical protein